MKVFKFVLIAVAVLVVLFIGAAIFFVATFDPNAYKEQIVAKTKEATGRDLALAGDIDLSVFPWLGFSLGSTQFGNAPGFGKAPMASVDEVDVRVALTPLLKGQVQAAKVKLNGLKVNLQKNAQGVTNWDDLVKETDSEEEEVASSETPEFELAINGVEITDAELLWQDDQAGTKIQIAPLNLTTGEIIDGKPTDVNLDLKMKNSAPAVDAEVALDTNALFDSKKQLLNLSNLVLTLKATGEPFPNGAVDLNLKSNVNGDLNSQQFTLNDTNIALTGTGDTFAGGTMMINLDSNIVANVQTQQYESDAIRIEIDGEGESLPNGKLKALLQTALQMNLDKETVQLSSLSIAMDDTQLNGNASIQSFEKPKIKFSLASKLLDLDKLLPTSSTEEKAESTPADENEPIELPTETMRDLYVNGDITVDTLKISGMTMTNVKATISAQNGLLQVTPMSMNLYDGTMKGKASVDVRGKTPKYALATDLAGVQIDKLSIDFLGEEQAYMRGISNLSLDINTTGNSVGELKRALGGKVNLNAGNGALRDKELAAKVEKAAAFMKGREPKPTGEEVVFDKLFGTFNIANGLSDNKDFKLDTPLIFANGEGKIDIGQSKTDYTLSVGLSEEPGKFAIPITIKGPFDDLSYGIDLQAALKAKQTAIVEEKKEELKEEIEEKKAEKVEELKEKIGDKLGDKLKDIKLF